MKILQLDFDDLKSPLGGGQARVTYEINRRLAKRHDVTVITSRYPGSKDEMIDRIKYKRVGLENFPWNFAAFVLTAPENIRMFDHDILLESFTPPVSTTFAPLFTKKPVVGIAHWLFAKEMTQKWKIPFIVWERIGLKYYHNFIVYNHDWANKIHSLQPKSEILVNTFPVNGPKIKTKFREEDYFLFLGRIDIHHKGLDLLIRAFEKISHQTSTKLIIAGGGREEKKFARIIKKSKSFSKIDFIGRYNAKMRSKLLSSCKFVVMPSRYEMAPLVAKEAMSYGKPMIIFNITGTREVVSPACAVYIRPYSVSDYAQAILDLLADKKRRIAMGKAARDRFEGHIDWDESAKKQEEFLLKIVQKSKNRKF